jgi:ketosteroid isomerase-like protein
MLVSLVSLATLCVALSARDVQEVGKLMRDTRTMPPSAHAHLLQNSPRCRRIAAAAGYGGRRVSVIEMSGLYAVLFGDELRMLDGRAGLAAAYLRGDGNSTWTRHMTTRATIEHYYDALRSKSEWDTLFADDVVFTSFTSPTRHISGRSAFVQGTKRFYSMIVSFELRELIIDGDKACGLTRYVLLAPNGGPRFSSDVAEIFAVKAGKIASFAIYFDTAPYPK